MNGGLDPAFQPWNAALLYLLSRDTTYASFAVTLVDRFVTEEEALIALGMAPRVADDGYREAATVLRNVSLVYDWCFDFLTGSQRARWIAYANRAAQNLLNPGFAQWGNMPHPWISPGQGNPLTAPYYGELLALAYLALATRDEHPDAQTWLDVVQNQRAQGDLFGAFQNQLIGGGSREGTGYGSGLVDLFELYILWQATTGNLLTSSTQHVQQSLPYLLHATSPTLTSVAPIGDLLPDTAGALNDRHRLWVQRLVHLFPSHPVARQAKRWLLNPALPRMTGEPSFFADFLYANTEVNPAPDLRALNTAYLAEGAGHIFVRNRWDADAVWLTFIVGARTEVRSHRDQGSLTLFRNGWLAQDQNIGSRSGLHREEEVHNLVRISMGGATLAQGLQTTAPVLRALVQNTLFAYGAADLTSLYEGQPAVQSVQREWLLLPQGVLAVHDRLQTDASATRTWQLNVPTAPVVTGSSAVVTNGAEQLRVTLLEPAAPLTSSDWTSLDADMTSGHRLDAVSTGTPVVHFVSVLSINGAASTVAGLGMHGANIQLQAGGSAQLTFGDADLGTTLTLTNAQSQMVFSGPVDLAVQAQPLLAPP